MKKDLEKLELLRQMIEGAEHSILSAKQILFEILGTSPKEKIYKKAEKLENSQKENVFEGIFNGENLILKDGKKYPVPPNYCSKSKLVEGDVLKLTIMPDGSLVYKQIGPVERKKIVGTLVKEDENKYKVLANGKYYKVLLAAVTYFKAKPNDKISLIVPKDGEAEWGSIEAVLPSKNSESK